MRPAIDLAVLESMYLDAASETLSLIMPVYVDSMARHMSDMRQAIEAGDAAALGAAAHATKGASRAVAAIEVADLCETLEMACHLGELSSAEATLRSIAAEFVRVEREWQDVEAQLGGEAPTAPMIRVLIVDDHPVARLGLTAMIRSYTDISVAGECQDAEEALRLIEIVHPDVVLMDLLLPGIDGADATRAMHERHPDLKVLMLSSSEAPAAVRRAIDAGAIGYIHKSIASEDLADALRNAYRGESSLSPGSVSALVFGQGYESLTERERNILSMMAKGRNNREISEQLYLARSTVKYYVSNILGKLGAESRTEAAAIGVREGLID